MHRDRPLCPADHRRPDRSAAPVTSGQLRLWFLDRYEPNSAAYVGVVTIRLRGLLQASALERAFARLVARQAALRTTIEFAAEEPVQRIHDDPRIPWRTVDLSETASAALDGRIESLIRDDARRGFDLAAGPLVRVLLFRRRADDHVLAMTLHHIITDGWSRSVVLRELAELYAAEVEERPPVLPTLDIDFGDFAVWQRQRLHMAELNDQVAHWKDRLAEVRDLDLPTDRPRPALQSFVGRRLQFELEPELVTALRQLGAARGATLFMVLLTAYGTLLSRWSSQDSFAVGVPIAGRNWSELEHLVGYFANTLVVPITVAGEPSFEQLLARIRAVAIDAYDHHDLPLDRLIEALEPTRDLSRNPVFQTMLTYQSGAAQTIEQGGLRWQLGDAEIGTSKVDLTLACLEDRGRLRCKLEYNSDLFDDGTAQRLARQLRRLLREALADPTRAVSRLPLLDDDERARVLVEWNRTAAPAPAATTIPELIGRQAARTPDAVALVRGGDQVTYRELWSTATVIARHLADTGVGLGDVVAVCGERRPSRVAALLGVMAAGAAHLPLDRRDPTVRQLAMLDDSGARMVLVDPDLAATFAATGRAVLSTAVADARSQPPWRPPPIAADALAYVLFTSGSSGRPKGVAVEHRSVVDRLVRIGELFSDRELAVVLGSTSLSFDVSLMELLTPLSRGGRVVLVDDITHVDQIPVREQISLIVTVPSAMAALIDNRTVPASARTVALLGEPLPPSLVDRILDHTGITRVLDLYGPTEDTICSTWTERTRGGPQTIGKPLPNTRAYVLDRHLQPVPIGVRGELVLGGIGQARGYLGRPDLTAERFVPDPFHDGGERLYRTGDLARWRADGTLALLGRLDRQLKIRGRRIEPGEIEAAFESHPDVVQAVVAPLGGGDGRDHDAELVAWVVSAAGVQPDPAGWRRHAAQRLPRQLVPPHVVPITSLPRTTSGKLDLAALPAPVALYPPPERTAQNELERAVADTFCNVLGLPEVGLDDDFFALGGHSLAALRVVSRLIDSLDVELPVVTLFERPTVSELADYLRNG